MQNKIKRLKSGRSVVCPDNPEDYITLDYKIMKKLFTLSIFVFFCLSANVAQSLHIKDKSLPCLDKKFSIVAHIVRDSFGELGMLPENIYENVDTLNAYFAPICLSFEVCDIRIIDNFQYNILEQFNLWEEMKVKYHQKNRINVFFVRNIYWVPLECGYTDLGSIDNVEDDGIIIKKGCTQPTAKSLTHEMGHYFGLLDTYQDDNIELVNGDNCETEGDLLCDTPADPFSPGDSLVQYLSLEETCRFIYLQTDANGAYYIPDTGNIMSHYPDFCKCGFTYQQYFRMAENYWNSGRQMW